MVYTFGSARAALLKQTSCNSGEPVPSNSGRSSVVYLVLRPRPDLRLGPLSIGLELGIWGPPELISHSEGRQRSPF